MKLKLYNQQPIDWLSDITSSLDSLWESPLRMNKNFLPSCDFYETDDYYFFSFDIPGVNKKDINIEFHDGALHISGEKKNEHRSKEFKGRQFFEKYYGKFQRSFAIPTAVKENEIEAQFKNGVLELLIPKANSGKGLKIPVTAEKKEGLFSRLLKN